MTARFELTPQALPVHDAVIADIMEREFAALHRGQRRVAWWQLTAIAAVFVVLVLAATL